MSKLNESLFFIVENTTNLQQIGLLHATDTDSGLNGKIEYKFDDQAENYAVIKQLFEIDQQTGSIYLTDGSKIDRELNTETKMKIIAYDQGEESKSTSITINICVLDINDNQPSFDSSFDLRTKFTIDENTINFAYKVTANDPDYGTVT